VTRPYPGARTVIEGRELRIWQAEPLADSLIYSALPQTKEDRVQ